MIYQTQNITNKQFWFFLLINTKSGGGWGKQYLTSKKKQFYFQYKQTTKVHVSLHDLLHKQSKQQALTKIKQLTQAQNQQIRVVICGGDGTMIWGVEETLFAGVDLNKIVFCCIPIGTGNDFSRTLGWGSSPIKFQDSNIFQLKKRIIQWLHAKIHYFDLWQIQIETYDNGDIICVKNKSQVSIQKRTFLRPFCNYVGIGIDARVSYSFQKHRKNTKLGNLIMYGCLGCCKLFKKIQTIQNSFQQFVQKKQNSIKEKLLYKQQPELKNETKEGQKQQQIQAGIKQAQEININVKKGYRGLICLNSTSYMAGRMNAWNTSKIGSKQQNKKFKTQQIDDGIIQFIGYKDQLRLGLQTLIHSGAKIAQGEGPFHIRLKKQLQIMETFIQIDGQGLKIRNLKSILIKKYEKIQNSKIRVLIRQKNK